MFTMKKISFVVTIVFSFFLAGCHDIIDAVSGINSKANEAAKAISVDVHTLRSIPIQMENQQTVTVNDFIKAILRDVQWKHEKKGELEELIADGSWKDGLFNEYGFTTKQKEVLKETGEVIVQIFFNDNQLQVDLTTVVLTNKDGILVRLTGKDALTSLQQAYNESLSE